MADECVTPGNCRTLIGNAWRLVQVWLEGSGRARLAVTRGAGTVAGPPSSTRLIADAAM